MPEVTKVTLDTNILQEYWKKQDKLRIVEKLLNLAEDGELDLAVTTRISKDIPHPPLSHRINQLPKLRIQEIGAVFRLGLSPLDGKDLIQDPKFATFCHSLSLGLSKRGRTPPDWRDWDHIHGHYLAKRDVFLTWDKRVLECARKLKEKFGVVLIKPEESLSNLEES